jgi:hypothetical protein
METLVAIQAELKCPKGSFNAFGKYKYRSLEDIFEGLKPLIKKHECSVTVRDEIITVECHEDVPYLDKGQNFVMMRKSSARIYVKATASLFDKDGKLVAEGSGYAREEENKKGMDSAQVTGATSSYARKYAMNGLFAIDDTKDSDATNTHGKETTQTKTTTKDSEW